MSNYVIMVSMALLLLGLFSGCIVIYQFLKKGDDGFSLRVMMAANFITVYFLSGIVHIGYFSSVDRGFYDLLKYNYIDILYAAVLSITAFLFLTWGMIGNSFQISIRRNFDQTFWLSSVDVLVLLGLIAILGTLGLYGLSQIKAYAAASGLERIIQVDGGLARYAYLSQWLPWPISLAALVLAGRRHRASETMTIVALGLACILIALTLRWSGGRSIIIVMVLPVVIALYPRLKSSKFLAIALGLAGFIFYLFDITAQRMAGTIAGSNTTAFGWIDWQWGRFSIVGFAVDYVNRFGLLFGETFFNAIIWTFGGFLNLVGLSIGDLGLRSSSAIVAQILTGDDSAIYIVPGLTAELFMNFGIIGVCIGYFFVGRLCRWTQQAIQMSENVVTTLFYAFIGSILVFRTLTSDSSALPSFIFYIGAPCWLAMTMIVFIRKHIGRRPR